MANYHEAYGITATRIFEALRPRAPQFDVEKVGNSYVVTQDGEPVEHPRRHASWDEARGRAAELRRGK